MSLPFRFAVSQSDFAWLEKTMSAGLWAHADLSPTYGGLYLESKSSGLTVMWTFSEALDVSVPGVNEWAPKHYHSQHVEAVDVLLMGTSYAGERVRPEWSWEVMLSTDDHAMLEGAARRGFVIGLSLAEGIYVSAPTHACVQWSFVSEVQIFDTVSGGLVGSSFYDVAMAFEALRAKERELAHE